MIIVVYLAAFAAAFNENIINTALVDIMAEFSVDAVTAQWLVSGYMAVSAIVVAVSAFLIKRIPFRALFAVSAAIMAVGSAVCLTASSFAVLFVARIASCIGAGVFIPAMMSAAIVLAPEGKMASYLAVGNAMATIGPAVAPVFSGMMVTMFGWRFVFLIPLVLSAGVFVAGLFAVRELVPLADLRLDALSLALVSAGLALFVFGLGQVSSSALFGLAFAAAGALLLVAFVVRQERIDNPLLDLAPVHVRGFMPACLLVFCSMMVAFSSSVLLPLYYEMSAGLSAFAAGALILLPVIANALVAIVAGRIMDKHGEWPLLPIGYLVLAVGAVLLAVSGVFGSVVAAAGSSVVVFSGVGLTFASSMTAGLKRLDANINAYGVSIMQVLTQMSTCIGPSLFVGIMSAVAAGLAAEGAGGASAQGSGFAVAMGVVALMAFASFVGAVAYAHRDRSLE